MAKSLSKGFKWTIGIIGSAVGLLLFLLLIGFIVDLCTYPALKKIGNKALKSLIVYNRNEPGNAWNYYSAAIEKSKNIPSAIVSYKYLDGSTEITQEMLQSFKDYEDAIIELKEGARQKYCSIPYDYSKGVAVKIPNFMALRKIGEITCARGLYELENDNTKLAIDDVLTVADVGKHIANSAPNLLNQMIGIVFLSQAMKVLKIGLSSNLFNRDELEKISKKLSGIEKDFPLLSAGLDGEKKQLEISFGNRSAFKSMRSLADLFFYENKMPSVFEHIVFRLFCWRYLFSPRLAAFRGFKFMDYIVSRMRELETSYEQINKKGQNDAQVREAISKNAKNYAAKNPVFSTMFPNFFSMYDRKVETITKIRILQLSCSIRFYYSENSRFPGRLQEIGGDIITDLNTGEMWSYTNYGDSCEIYSPGPNPKNTHDNFSIVLTKMGIKEYLENRRKGIRSR